MEKAIRRLQWDLGCGVQRSLHQSLFAGTRGADRRGLCPAWRDRGPGRCRLQRLWPRRRGCAGDLLRAVLDPLRVREGADLSSPFRTTWAPRRRRSCRARRGPRARHGRPSASTATRSSAPARFRSMPGTIAPTPACTRPPSTTWCSAPCPTWRPPPRRRQSMLLCSCWNSVAISSRRRSARSRSSLASGRPMPGR